MLAANGDLRRHAGRRQRLDEDHGDRRPLSQEEEGRRQLQQQQQQQHGQGREGVSHCCS
jgi:hypothetical protein